MLQSIDTESYVKSFFPAYLDDYYIHIPSKKRCLFPNYEAQIQIIYNAEIYQAWVLPDSNGGFYIGRFKEWFKKHGLEFKEAGKVIITADKQNNRYYIKISKK